MKYIALSIRPGQGTKQVPSPAKTFSSVEELHTWAQGNQDCLPITVCQVIGEIEAGFVLFKSLTVDGEALEPQTQSALPSTGLDASLSMRR